jgi:hypothetical protein
MQKHSKGIRANNAVMKDMIKDHRKEIRRLRRLLDSQKVEQETREKAESRLGELEAQVRADVASLAGGLVIDSSDSANLRVYQPKAPTIYARASQASERRI